MNIGAVQPVQPLDASLGALSETGSSASSNFSSVLRSAYADAERSGAEAGRLTEQFLLGETQDLHTVALAGQRASLQFEMLLQVRNKIVQAYQEVMRMQL